jgi:hypothetical protein
VDHPGQRSRFGFLGMTETGAAYHIPLSLKQNESLLVIESQCSEHNVQKFNFRVTQSVSRRHCRRNPVMLMP